MIQVAIVFCRKQCDVSCEVLLLKRQASKKEELPNCSLGLCDRLPEEDCRGEWRQLLKLCAHLKNNHPKEFGDMNAARAEYGL